MIYFDAHVHIQDIFSLDAFLKSSLDNFSQQAVDSGTVSPGTFFLLLTEGKKNDYFSMLKSELEQRSDILPGTWQIESTHEPESLLFYHNDWPETKLFIIAGRQIVTLEKLEVLALGTVVKFDDGMPIVDTVRSVQEQQGLAVLPWGAGKWLGKRGTIIDKLVATENPERLFVGDNGGRPVFWPTPGTFAVAAKRGIRLLPGSDPLPLAREEQRAGSFGGFFEGECSPTTPFADLKVLLADQDLAIKPFGKNQGSCRFFRTQIALRLK